MKPSQAVILLLTLALLAGGVVWLASVGRKASSGQVQSYARTFEKGQASAPSVRQRERMPDNPSSYADASEAGIQKVEGYRYSTY